MQILVWMRKHWAGLIILLILSGTIWAIRGTQLLGQRAKYTVGSLTGWHTTLKNGLYYDYRFSVAGTTYQGANPGGKHTKEVVGTLFLVKYDSLTPTSNVGFLDLPIPDSIGPAPRRGWLKPPFPVPQWILDRDRK